MFSLKQLSFYSPRKGYTFFAPTNMAFVKMLPQDVVDPFFVDSQLRTNLLLHHFSLYKRTADELFEASKKDAMSLSMALNGRFVDLSYSGEPESPGESVTQLLYINSPH